VEIYFKNKIEIVYFIKHPACSFLTESDKQQLLETVDRKTRFNKIYDFMGRFNQLFDKIEHFSSFYYTKWSVLLNKQVFQLLRIISFCLLFFINLYYFFYDKKVIKDNKSTSVFLLSNPNDEYLFRINLITSL